MLIFSTRLLFRNKTSEFIRPWTSIHQPFSSRSWSIILICWSGTCDCQEFCSVDHTSVSVLTDSKHYFELAVFLREVGMGFIFKVNSWSSLFILHLKEKFTLKLVIPNLYTFVCFSGTNKSIFFEYLCRSFCHALKASKSDQKLQTVTRKWSWLFDHLKFSPLGLLLHMQNLIPFWFTICLKTLHFWALSLQMSVEYFFCSLQCTCVQWHKINSKTIL